MVFFRRTDEEEELETPEDEDAALADDVLDEVEGEVEEAVGADELEGFGLITEDVAEEEEEKEENEEEESLEEDAEDVDFDTFDDVDEL
jgi:hypothetical protein